MFRSVTIENLRLFEKIQLTDFKQFNLLAGENNSGKTTILEALFLLISPTNPSLPLKINLFRNLNFINNNLWPIYFRNLDFKREIKLIGVYDDPPEDRTLVIIPNHESKDVVQTLQNGKIVTKDSYTDTARGIDGLLLKSRIKNRQSGETVEYQSRLKLVKDKIESQGPDNYQEHLNGRFVTESFLHKGLKDQFGDIEMKKQTGRLVKILQQIDPDIVDLALSSDDLVYCDIGLDNMVPLNVVGDGMVRLSAILMDISNTENGVVLIDEIENGFHYTSLKILWESIFRTAREFNVQIFATTHSAECIRAFVSSYNESALPDDNIRVYRIEKHKNVARVVTFDQDVLHTYLDSDMEIR